MRLSLSILLLTLLGCSEYSGPDYPRVLVAKDSSQFSITPTYNVVGDVIMISDTGFGPSYPNMRIRFFGGVEIQPDGSESTHLFVTVPFGALSGYVTVTGDAYADSLPISILEFYDADTLQIRWYNLERPLTPSDGTITSRWDDTVYWNDWTVTRSGDTVTFDVNYWSYFDTYAGYTIRLKDAGPDSLPILIRAEYRPRIGLIVLQKGLLKIQDWDTSKVISGKFFSYQGSAYNKRGFWYDFSQKP